MRIRILELGIEGFRAIREPLALELLELRDAMLGRLASSASSA